MIFIYRDLLREMTESVKNLKGRKPQVLFDNEIYIGRHMFMGGWQLPKSKWANPFKITEDTSREDVLRQYKAYVISTGLVNSIEELKGKTLVCWCSPEKCHGDVLLELLNRK